jgi:IQ calmodulin-binding motif
MAAISFSLGKEDYMQILDLAKLAKSVDYGTPDDSCLPMTASASSNLSQFITSGAKSWQLLTYVCRFKRKLRTLRNIQSTLRGWLHRRRQQRASEAEQVLIGLVAFYRSSFQLCILKRRAALLIQSSWRMAVVRRRYLRTRAELMRHFSAIRLQRFFRNLKIQRAASKIKKTARIAQAVDCMQKSARRLFCTTIMYLRAVNLRKEACCRFIQACWRSRFSRRRVSCLPGFRIIALHAKLIALALANTQTIISRHCRGHLSRCEFPGERKKLKDMHAAHLKFKRESKAAVKIQAWIRERFARLQFAELRWAAFIVQTRLRTTLAPLYGPS